MEHREHARAGHRTNLRQSRRFGAFFTALMLGMAAIAVAASTAFALSPTVATQPASAIGGAGATLKGLVNPNGSETKFFFEYGTTASYGSKTSETSAGSGSATVEVSHPISGLKANTEYHYRIVASNSFGSSQGIDKTFTTASPPEVSSLSAEPHGSGEGATLKAWVDPNGQSTTYQFEYGEWGSYSKFTPVESAGSEPNGKYVTYTLTDLMPGTRYWYRIIASSAGGEVGSGSSNFVSSSVPGIGGESVYAVLSKEATLRANINTHGSAASYYFEYGTTASYGTKVPASPKEINAGGGPEMVSVSELVTGLQPNTLYHYRAVAENSFGKTNGTDQTFTTPPAMILRYKGGEKLKSGAPLKLFSTNLTFKTESTSRSCGESEFSGEVSENPGALQAVSTMKMQAAGGAGCPLSGFTIKYSTPTKGITIWYTRIGTVGLARLSKFTLVGTVFWGALKIADCEYNLEMTSLFTRNVALSETYFGGETEPVKQPQYCPGAEFVGGTFAVTSGGTSVEAE